MIKLLKAAAVYFALTFGAGFVLGAIRVTLVVPRLGVRSAELLEMPLMLVVVVLAAHSVARRFDLPVDSGTRLAVGSAALALLIGAELLLAVGIEGRSLGEYVAARDPVSGSAYLAMLALFALMPLLLARLWAHR